MSERETAVRTLEVALSDYRDTQRRLENSQHALYAAVFEAYKVGVKRSWLQLTIGWSKSHVYNITLGLDPVTKEPLRLR